MARLAAKLEENVAGAFFVDDSCIDCEACRQIAPASFARSPRLGQSFVFAQPHDAHEEKRARMAIVACPTSSIGTEPKRALGDAVDAFPELLDEDVYDCGWRAESSYGAASYVIRRSSGNVLVDSPRAGKALFSRLKLIGGVKTMILSHRDDVADHESFAREFGCECVMHTSDVGDLSIERQLEGNDPIALDDDLLAIPVPGHTRGSIAILYREKYLFTGDHLWWDDDDGRLDMGRGVCWYSWSEQCRSLERLRDFNFEWVLPGHGRRWRAKDHAAMRAALDEAITRLAKHT